MIVNAHAARRVRQQIIQADECSVHLPVAILLVILDVLHLMMDNIAFGGILGMAKSCIADIDQPTEILSISLSSSSLKEVFSIALILSRI